jgi:hypothetical protein
LSGIDLRQIPLAELIVELILDGRAGYLPALLPFEPISITGILAELHRRTDQKHGANAGDWCKWALNDWPGANDHDRLTIEFATIYARIRVIERRVQRKLARRATSAPADPET